MGKPELLLPHIQPHEIFFTQIYHNPGKPRTVPFPQKLVPAAAGRMYIAILRALGHVGFPTVTSVAPLWTVNARKHGKMKKCSAFPNSLALAASHGVDDNAEYSSIPVLLSNGALHYLVQYY